jgi:hypothetical protein
MYIENGATVDATWTKAIAWSSDNTNWNTLNKNGLSVHHNIVNKNIASPLVKRSTSFLITIKKGEDELLQFDIQDVVGKGTWAATAAGLQVAVDDISNWISN